MVAIPAPRASNFLPSRIPLREIYGVYFTTGRGGGDRGIGTIDASLGRNIAQRRRIIQSTPTGARVVKRTLLSPPSPDLLHSCRRLPKAGCFCSALDSIRARLLERNFLTICCVKPTVFPRNTKSIMRSICHFLNYFSS